MDTSNQPGQKEADLLRSINMQVAARPPQRAPHLLYPNRPIFFHFTVASIFVLIAHILMSSTSGNFVLHQVPEGHVGVYWRGGALTKTITNPGFHLKMPFITKYEPIQVMLRTNLVHDVHCGTRDGVMISFGKIEVVSRLKKEYIYDTLLNYGVHYDKTWIDDKIHDEINQFCNTKSLQQVYIDVFDQIAHIMKEAIQRDCSEYAPGIEIMSVRVPKPNIPATIRRNFELLEEERTKAFIEIEKRKVAEKEAATKIKVALSEALDYFQELIRKHSSRYASTYALV